MNKKTYNFKNKKISTPYHNITTQAYNLEKKRLQLELLKIQQNVMKKKRRVAIIFDGRDAAGKGSTIARFTENLIPSHCRLVNLGIPTPKESKNWFKRYEKHLPKQGEMVFFDRSWYNRALIEPTMNYCKESQYRYFMHKVLGWEHNLMNKGLELVKFYLSVDSRTQMIRFNNRLSDPLRFWKFSENDLKAYKKWKVFTYYKDQMFNRTSSPESPWITVNSNSKIEARLTCMLYVVEKLANKQFTPLIEELIFSNYKIELNGIAFKNLNAKQYAVLKRIKKQYKY